MDAFSNGARYLCGRCVPVYAPVISFPLTTSVSESHAFEGWKNAFDELNQNRIQSLYLPPQAATTELLDYLASQSVLLVGSSTPLEGYTSIWAATVRLDTITALEDMWADLLQPDTGPKVVNAPVVIGDINEQLLTPGKLGLVEKVAADLASGWIAPLSLPLKADLFIRLWTTLELFHRRPSRLVDPLSFEHFDDGHQDDF